MSAAIVSPLTVITCLVVADDGWGWCTCDEFRPEYQLRTKIMTKHLIAFVIVISLILFSWLSAEAKTINIYSDSTLTGVAADTNTPPVYSVMDLPPKEVLQALLDRHCGPGVSTVRAFAFGGHTLAQMMVEPKPALGNQTLYNHILTTDADVVIVGFGINDVFATPEGKWQFAHSHHVLRSAAEWAGVKYFAETPNPVTYTTTHDSLLWEFSETLKWLADEVWGVPVIDTRNRLLAFPAWVAHMGDGIHPNQPLIVERMIGVFQYLVEAGEAC